MKRVITVLTGLLLVLGASASLAGPYDDCLFFSEYIEGSSYNKAVEIYNATEAAVDLSTLEIVLYSNGSASPTSTFQLPAVMLGVGQTFVVCHPSADPALLAVAGVTSGTVNFNGDDAFVLQRVGGQMLDVIGQIGFDPGSYWGSGDVTTQDHTLRRMMSVCCGDPDGSDAFDPALEWDGYPINTFDGFGSHLTDCQAVGNEDSTWGSIKGLYR